MFVLSGVFMTFIERLNTLMKQKNISKAFLTKELHIGKNQIKYWEDNNTIPDGTTLLKISDYFDVSVDYLLGKTDKKNKATPEEQPISPKQKLLLDVSADMTDEDIKKLIEYADLLNLRHNQ